MAEREHHGLPGPRPQRRAGRATVVGGQAEGEHRGGQLVAHDADGRPRLAVAGRGSRAGGQPGRQAGDDAGRAQRQGRQRTGVQAVRRAGGGVREAADRHPGRRQPLQHRRQVARERRPGPRAAGQPPGQTALDLAAPPPQQVRALGQGCLERRPRALPRAAPRRGGVGAHGHRTGEGHDGVGQPGRPRPRGAQHRVDVLQAHAQPAARAPSTAEEAGERAVLPVGGAGQGHDPGQRAAQLQAASEAGHQPGELLAAQQAGQPVAVAVAHLTATARPGRPRRPRPGLPVPGRSARRRRPGPVAPAVPRTARARPSATGSPAPRPRPPRARAG